MSHPQNQVILTGYGNEFAQEWGRQSRNIFDRLAPQLFGLNLNKRNSKADHWSINNHAGSMRTCGTLGSITGKGAHLLISDDQVKDQAQANSPTQRNTVHSWFMSDALTRLAPDGKCIVVLSRRHPDDLVGRLLDQGGWRELRLPALCDDPENDPLHRKDGDALWDAQWNKSALLTIRDDLAMSGQDHIWECQYQQNPTGDPGSREFPPDYFNGIWCPTVPSEGVRLRVLALDPSKGRRAHTGDYSAFCYLVLTNSGDVYVQSWLMRTPIDKLINQATALLQQLQPDAFIYESIAFQELLGMDIAKECASKGIPCPIHKFESMEDKNVRIRMMLTPLLGQHKLHLCEDTPSNRLGLNQMRDFPTGVHDDFLDATCMGLELLRVLLTGRRAAQNIVLRT